MERPPSIRRRNVGQRARPVEVGTEGRVGIQPHRDDGGVGHLRHRRRRGLHPLQRGAEVVQGGRELHRPAAVDARGLRPHGLRHQAGRVQHQPGRRRQPHRRAGRGDVGHRHHHPRRFRLRGPGREHDARIVSSGRQLQRGVDRQRRDRHLRPGQAGPGGVRHAHAAPRSGPAAHQGPQDRDHPERRPGPEQPALHPVPGYARGRGRGVPVVAAGRDQLRVRTGGGERPLDELPVLRRRRHPAQPGHADERGRRRRRRRRQHHGAREGAAHRGQHRRDDPGRRPRLHRPDRRDRHEPFPQVRSPVGRQPREPREDRGQGHRHHPSADSDEHRGRAGPLPGDVGEVGPARADLGRHRVRREVLPLRLPGLVHGAQFHLPAPGLRRDRLPRPRVRLRADDGVELLLPGAGEGPGREPERLGALRLAALRRRDRSDDTGNTGEPHSDLLRQQRRHAGDPGRQDPAQLGRAEGEHGRYVPERRSELDRRRDDPARPGRLQGVSRRHIHLRDPDRGQDAHGRAGRRPVGAGHGHGLQGLLLQGVGGGPVRHGRAHERHRDREGQYDL